MDDSKVLKDHRHRVPLIHLQHDFRRLNLIETAVRCWQPTRQIDKIIHGHYNYDIFDID